MMTMSPTAGMFSSPRSIPPQVISRRRPHVQRASEWVDHCVARGFGTRRSPDDTSQLAVGDRTARRGSERTRPPLDGLDQHGDAASPVQFHPPCWIHEVQLRGA
jgi:hypothetical protein